MAEILHTNVQTYHCIDNVTCNDVISDVWANKLSQSQKGLASSGYHVCSLSNGMTHGRKRPICGWSAGRNYNTFTGMKVRHMVEITDLFDRYVIQFQGKLGDYGNRDHQWITFHLEEPGSGTTQRLAQLKKDTYTQNSPIEYLAPPETNVSVRIEGALNAAMIPSAGQCWSMNFWIKITSYGDYDSRGFNITDNNYWSGIRSASLWFYRKCS